MSGESPSAAASPAGRLLDLMTGKRAFIAFALKRAGQDNLPGVAASLSYTALLALVPLLAMGFAILTAFPAFDDVRDDLQAWIVASFVPATGHAVEEMLDRFVRATGRLTSIGVAGLAVTAILMLMTIERAFNAIFRVTRPRPLLMRLMVFWMLLTLGPLLAGTSVGLAGYLAATASAAGRSLGVEGLWPRVSGLLPILLSAAFCGLLYMVVPNRRVALRDAAAGAVAAALLIAALRYGFVKVVVGGRTYQTLYGALAVVPLFLVWTYLSWLAVLVGAELAALLPEWRHQRRLADQPAQVRRLGLVLDILAALAEAARAGRGLRRTELMARTAAAETALAAELETLRQLGYLARGDDGCWLALRPLDQASLGRLLDELGLSLPAPGLPAGRPWDHRLEAALEAARAGAAPALALPLADLLPGHIDGAP